MEEARKEQQTPKPVLERILKEGFRYVTFCDVDGIYAKDEDRILYNSQTDSIVSRYKVPAIFRELRELVGE